MAKRTKRQIFQQEAARRFEIVKTALDGLKELANTQKFQSEGCEKEEILKLLAAEVNDVGRAFEPRNRRLSFGGGDD